VDGGEMEIYLLSNFDPDSFKPNWSSNKWANW
jgi:hypothetical protein